MKSNKGFIIISMVSLVLLGVKPAFCQENKIISGPSTEEKAPAVKEGQWIWGEITSIDLPTGKIGVKYLDFENDSEKEITIVVGQQTVLGNLASLDQLKLKDNVSIDYITTPEGDNLAKTISAEKMEDFQGNAPAQGEMLLPEEQMNPPGPAGMQPPEAPEAKPEEAKGQ